MSKIVLLILFFTVVNFLDAAPSWFRNPNNYIDRNVYLAGVGQGDSYEQARTRAQASISEQISVDVESISTNVMNAYFTLSGSAVHDELIDQSRTYAREQVNAAEILREEIYNGIHYVMVGLNKVRVLRRISAETEEIQNGILRSISQAQEFTSRNQIVLALDSYHESVSMLADIIQQKVFFDAFSDRILRINENINESRIRHYITTLINNIRFEVVNDTENLSLRGRQFSSPVTFRANHISSDGRSTILQNLPVALFFGNDTEVETGITNNLGEFGISTIREPTRGNVSLLRIQIDPKRYPYIERSILNNARAEVNFSATPFQVQLRVVDQSGNVNNAAQTMLSGLLTQDRRTQHANAPVIVLGTLEWSSSQIGSFTTVTAHLNINVSVVASNQILGSHRLMGSATSSMGEADALNIAIGKMSERFREFQLLMQKVERDFLNLSY